MTAGYVLAINEAREITQNDTMVSPRMRTLLARAALIGAQHTGQRLIATETVLRALVDDQDGIAGQVISELGVSEKVRDRLDEIMSSPGYGRPSRVPGST